MNKEVIYVGGDSYAAGEDLADHLIPGYAYRSTNDLLNALNTDKLAEEIYSWIIRRNEFIDKTNSHKLWTDTCHELWWSSVLEKLLSKKVMNISSKGGSSVYAICYRAVYDIKELQAAGYKITDAIIQLTGTGRYSFFTRAKDKNIPYEKYQITSFNTSHSTFKRLTDEIVKIEDYEMSLYRTFYELYVTEILIENLIGKKPIFVDSMFFKHSEFHLPDPRFNPFNLIVDNNHPSFVTDFSKSLGERTEFSMRDCVEHNDEKVWTTNYHFTREVHERFAKKIAERYFK